MIHKSECKRILVVKLSSIGDVVMATPVAKALREAFPKAYIAWVVEEKSKDAILGNPYLDEVIVWERGRDKGLEMIAQLARDAVWLRKELRSRRFDVAVDLQGLLRSAIVSLLSGARYRLGTAGAGEGAPIFYNIPEKTSRSIRGSQHYLAILEPLGIYSRDVAMHMPVSEQDEAFARTFVAESIVRYRRRNGIVAMVPATTWAQKHWTEEGWAQLADTLIEDYDMLPVFLGSKADVALRDRVFSLMKHSAADLVGQATLTQSAALVEQSDLVFSVDTGLLHIAMAFERPTIGIFGPTEWRLLLRGDILKVVAKDFPCMPCMRRPTCEGFLCMRAISPSDVLRAAEKWLPSRIPTK